MTEIKDRLVKARKDAGYDFASDAARAFGWNEVTYRSHENGARVPKLPTVNRYARAFGVSPAWLLTGGSPAAPDPNAQKVTPDTVSPPGGLVPADSPVMLVPVVGVVEAGAFREVDDQSQLDISDLPRVAISIEPRFQGMKVTGFEVRGDSMDLEVPDGGTIMMVDIIDYVDKYGFPETGKLVVVERRNGGHSRERTVKQVVSYKDRIELVPRSSNPRHKPITVPLSDLDDPSCEIQVIGVVTWSGKRH